MWQMIYAGSVYTNICSMREWKRRKFISIVNNCFFISLGLFITFSLLLNNNHRSYSSNGLLHSIDSKQVYIKKRGRGKGELIDMLTKCTPNRFMCRKKKFLQWWIDHDLAWLAHKTSFKWTRTQAIYRVVSKKKIELKIVANKYAKDVRA